MERALSRKFLLDTSCVIAEGKRGFKVLVRNVGLQEGNRNYWREGSRESRNGNRDRLCAEKLSLAQPRPDRQLLTHLS